MTVRRLNFGIGPIVGNRRCAAVRAPHISRVDQGERPERPGPADAAAGLDGVFARVPVASLLTGVAGARIEAMIAAGEVRTVKLKKGIHARLDDIVRVDAREGGKAAATDKFRLSDGGVARDDGASAVKSESARAATQADSVIPAVEGLFAHGTS